MTHASTAEAASLSCRCDCDEPGLDELLADEIMDPVTRSAHLDRERLRQQLSEVALRIYIKTTA
ncbi:MAG: hypothetical protein ACRED6_01885 [Stellaceae bacterium]